MPDKSIKKFGLSKKIMVNVVFSVILILVFTFVAYYSVFYFQLKRSIQQRITGLAQTAALLIDGDGHNRLKTRADESSYEYKQMKKLLQDFRKANPDIRYIYTMRKTSEQNVYEFVVDAEVGSSENFSHIGDKYNVSKFEELQKAYDGPIADEHFEIGRWGKFLAGYAPIWDNSGSPVAIVGIDFKASTLMNTERDLAAGAIAVFSLSLALAIFTTSKGVKHFMIPINQIIEMVKRFKNGDLNYRVDINTNDEFQEIGAILNETGDIMIKYHRILEKDLENTKQQREKIFKVYKDVIYSITQGKFNLLNYKESLVIAQEGQLCEQIKLEKPEDVSKARHMTETFFKETYNPEQVRNVKLCVSEAATNVIIHATEGIIQIRKLCDRLRIVITDSGGGLDFDKLPYMVFLKGFSTKPSLGYGFFIIYKYPSKIYLSTSKHGTSLVLDFEVRCGSEKEIESAELA